MITITRTWVGDTVALDVQPTLVDGYTSSRESLNIVHELLGGGVAVSQRGTRSRAGTLRLFFPGEDDAKACADLHAERGIFSFTEDARATLTMSYVVSGSIAVELDDTTRDHWMVLVDYREVDA